MFSFLLPSLTRIHPQTCLRVGHQLLRVMAVCTTWITMREEHSGNTPTPGNAVVDLLSHHNRHPLLPREPHQKQQPWWVQHQLLSRTTWSADMHVMWCHLISHDVVWCHTCHVMWCKMMSHHQCWVLCCTVMWCNVMWCAGRPSSWLGDAGCTRWTHLLCWPQYPEHHLAPPWTCLRQPRTTPCWMGDAKIKHRPRFLHWPQWVWCTSGLLR